MPDVISPFCLVLVLIEFVLYEGKDEDEAEESNIIILIFFFIFLIHL